MASTPKVTSLDSSSGAPTPPHPTPVAGAKSEVDDIPVTDLEAVDRSLRPIQEELNEAAEEAMLPSPPINSPAFSPSTSVIVRQIQRTRGMSTIGDHLGHLTMIDVNSSAHSDVCSTDEDGDVGGVTVPVIMDSPTTKSLLQHYLARRAQTGGGASIYSDTDKANDGVCEKNNWAEEVMDSLERALLRLEQLADDEGAASNKSAEDFYRERLLKALEAANRKYPVGLKD